VGRAFPWQVPGLGAGNLICGSRAGGSRALHFTSGQAAKAIISVSFWNGRSKKTRIYSSLLWFLGWESHVVSVPFRWVLPLVHGLH